VGRNQPSDIRSARKRERLGSEYKKSMNFEKFIDKRIAFGTLILKESPADKWTFKKR